jgi:uncharacterized protein YdeI (BOF family)
MRLKRVAQAGAATVAATVACLVGLMAGTALAAVTDIGSILTDPAAYKDQVVSVTGTIDQVIEGNEFMLKDATGTIKIDGGPSWFKDLGLAISQSFTISGEVDLGKDGTGAAEIDIFSVTDASGAVIATVREAGGRPPWAGGPQSNGQTPGQGVADDDTDTPGQGKADTAGKPDTEQDLDTDSD